MNSTPKNTKNPKILLYSSKDYGIISYYLFLIYRKPFTGVIVSYFVIFIILFILTNVHYIREEYGQIHVLGFLIHAIYAIVCIALLSTSFLAVETSIYLGYKYLYRIKKDKQRKFLEFLIAIYKTGDD